MAPITGTVMTLSLTGRAGGSLRRHPAIVIADNSVMTVNISVDDRQLPVHRDRDGAMLNDWNGNLI